MRSALLALVLTAAWAASARAHDIPNARVDRSIQVTVRPGGLSIDYEITLSELTLTQDLRALTGALPGADRREWFEEYARVVGPLNARGLLVHVDGRPLDLRPHGDDLAVEDHVRVTFHFAADLPTRGRLSVRDTNYANGEGQSRLAVRGEGGVVVRGDDLPGDVSLIPYRPAWQLSDAEERRTTQVVADFESVGVVGGGGGGVGRAVPPPARPPAASVAPTRPGVSARGLSRLLDRAPVSVPGMWLIALTMGAAHAVQPGHGKSLVAAASVGGRGGGVGGSSWPW